MTNRLLATTVVRHADLAQDSGFVYLLNLDNKQILLAVPMPESVHRARERNPRGGLRGARGVAIWGDRLVLANTERLLFLDSRWRLHAQFSHPLLGGIHDLLAQEDGVWATSTNADLLVKVSWTGEIIADWSWREDAHLRRAFGLDGLPPLNRDLDYRDPATMRGGPYNCVHLNGLAEAPGGGLLLSFGRILSPARYRRTRVQGWLGAMAQRGSIQRRRSRDRSQSDLPVSRLPGSSAAIVWLKESGQTEILLHARNTTVPYHNVLSQNERLLYNDSDSSVLISRSFWGSGPTQHIPIPGSPGFARGLALVNPETAWVGSQAPAAVHRVNLSASTVTDTFVLSSRPTESVFALCPLPAQFAAPPPTLEGLA